MYPLTVPFLTFIRPCGWHTWLGVRGHSEAACQLTIRQVAATLILDVSVGEE